MSWAVEAAKNLGTQRRLFEKAVHGLTPRGRRGKSLSGGARRYEYFSRLGGGSTFFDCNLEGSFCHRCNEVGHVRPIESGIRSDGTISRSRNFESLLLSLRLQVVAQLITNTSPYNCVGTCMRGYVGKWSGCVPYCHLFLSGLSGCVD